MRAKPSLLILLACLIAISCDGHTTVKGFVYDSKDQPIQDALVTLKYNDQTFTAHTDKDGAYNVGLTHGPFFADLTLAVVKEGYKPYELSFSANSRPTGYHKVVLKSQSRENCGTAFKHLNGNSSTRPTTLEADSPESQLRGRADEAQRWTAALISMRDNHSGMPEIMEAFERSDHYFGVIKISLAETSKQFEFGVSREGYRALKKILQLRPFDSMPGVSRKFFFVAKYGKLPNGPNYSGCVRVEQGRDGKELEVSLPKDLLANLVWFSQIKNFGEASHLPEIKTAPQFLTRNPTSSQRSRWASR